MCGGGKKPDKVEIPAAQPLPAPTPQPTPSSTQSAVTEKERASRTENLRRGIASTVKTQQGQQAGPSLESSAATMYDVGKKKTLG